MNSANRKLYLPLVVLFTVVNGGLIAAGNWLEGQGISRNVVLSGNALLFAVSVGALYFHIQGFFHKNVNVFLRSVYTSLLLKMFATLLAIGVYAWLSGDALNKRGLFACMVLYFMYTIVEVRAVLGLLKHQKKDV